MAAFEDHLQIARLMSQTNNISVCVLSAIKWPPTDGNSIYQYQYLPKCPIVLQTKGSYLMSSKRVPLAAQFKMLVIRDGNRSELKTKA